jgi:hypothetical protein
MIGLWILVAGVLITLIGIDLVSCMGRASGSYYSSYYQPPFYVMLFSYLVVVIGVATGLYGLRRLVDGISKGDCCPEPQRRGKAVESHEE